MAHVDWYVEGPVFGNCNCVGTCPCQFEADPTDGHCRGFEVLEIETGHFGETDLAGLRVAVLYAWPGPIYKGAGEMLAVIDERATPEQYKALETVLHGGETEELATHWWVFRAMCDTVHETMSRRIDLDVDIDARRATTSIAGLLTATGRPISPPHTEGAEHRVSIKIPGGIEFEEAEVGWGSSKTESGPIAFDYTNTYGQFNRLRHGPGGVVR